MTDVLRSDQAVLNVLVVDDNVTLGQTLGWLIEALGERAHIYTDARAALEGLAGLKVDAAFLDIGMPFMTGLELCSALREKPEFAGLTIVAQTGYGDVNMKRKAEAAGFDLHLTKPVDINDIRDVLTDVRLRKELSAAARVKAPSATASV